MNGPHWFSASGDPDPLAGANGRRFFVLTAAAGAAVALSGCEFLERDRRLSIDATIQNTEYYQDRRVGVCYARPDNQETDTIYVPCTPEVLALIADRERRDK